MERMSVEFDLRSQMSMSDSFYFQDSTQPKRPAAVTRSDRLGPNPVESSLSSRGSSRRGLNAMAVSKVDQKKLRKAMERAMRMERKESRKMQKRANKLAKARGEKSSRRLTQISTGTISVTTPESDHDILTEIWNMRSSSCERFSDEDMPEVDGEYESAQTHGAEHMDFLFYGGCPDDKSLHELEVGQRRMRSNPRVARRPATQAFAHTIPIRPTLVSNMPPVFVPRMDAFMG